MITITPFFKAALCGAGLLLASMFACAAEVPKLINYQGKLTNATGEALPDGEYSVKFELYDAATDGNLVWGESRTVTLIKGVFNVALGGSGSLPVVGAAVNDIGFAFGDSNRFLQTTIVSGPEGTLDQVLTPRQQMNSVPFSLATRFSPVSGSIIMHHDYSGLAPVPRGWMICDGSVIGQPAYDSIHGDGAWERDGLDESNLLGKLTPDLRDRYAVGASVLNWPGVEAVPFQGNQDHRIDLSHSHTVDVHSHRWLRQDSRGYGKDSYNSSGNLVDMSNGQPNTGKRIVINTAQEGLTGTYYTDRQSPGTDSQLSANQSIQPESVQVFYIIKL
jgi:hypothetical protein